MATRREQQTDDSPGQVTTAAVDPASLVQEKPGVVRHVTFAIGEGPEQRWGWEGLDISGQVVTRCEPTFPSQASAEKDAEKV